MEVTVTSLMQAAGLTDEFATALKNGDLFHLTVENPPYMRLVIEVVAPGEVSVAHYYEQNGDAMRDPEIVFNQRWLPIEITQDPVGIHRRAGAGYYLKSVQELARMCAMNIRHQEFITHGMFNSSTHKLAPKP